MLFLYCRTLSPRLVLSVSHLVILYFSGPFFRSLPASLPLFHCGDVRAAACLCCGQLLISTLACPYISSSVILPLSNQIYIRVVSGCLNVL